MGGDEGSVTVGLRGWEWLVILVIVLLLFGAPRLPALARSLGSSLKIFRREVSGDTDTEADDAPAQDDDPA